MKQRQELKLRKRRKTGTEGVEEKKERKKKTKKSKWDIVIYRTDILIDKEIQNK